MPTVTDPATETETDTAALARLILAACDEDERPAAATACVVVRDDAGRTVAIRDVCLTSP